MVTSKKHTLWVYDSIKGIAIILRLFIPSLGPVVSFYSWLNLRLQQAFNVAIFIVEINSQFRDLFMNTDKESSSLADCDHEGDGDFFWWAATFDNRCNRLSVAHLRFCILFGLVPQT